LGIKQNRGSFRKACPGTELLGGGLLSYSASEECWRKCRRPAHTKIPLPSDYLLPIPAIIAHKASTANYFLPGGDSRQFG
jgi:hypothetical protein